MGLKLEDARRVAIGLRELRNKEMTAKLTYGEQQELESLLALKSQEFPDCRAQQMASDVKLTAIRNYTFNDVTPKENLFQKLFKKENVKEYEIRVINEEEDVAEACWTYSFALDLRQLMDGSGLGLDWPKMMPVQDDMAYTDPMEEEDQEWFGSFPDPAWCHTKLLEAAAIEEKAEVYGEEMLEAVRWLKDHWENGYQIYADTGDLFDYYGDDELD